MSMCMMYDIVLILYDIVLIRNDMIEVIIISRQ